MNELKSVIASEKEHSLNVAHVLMLVQKYADVKTLDAEIIREFVREIYVCKAEKIDGRQPFGTALANLHCRFPHPPRNKKIGIAGTYIPNYLYSLRFQVTKIHILIWDCPFLFHNIMLK